MQGKRGHMRLYHGTKVLFEEIDLKKAKLGKDFGKGFYLTTNLAQALEWAKRGQQSRKTGFVIEFEFDEKYLESSDLKIKKLTAYNKEWVEFVSLCRLELYDTTDDIIYDRMADSKYNILTKALEKYYNGIYSIDAVLRIASFADKEYNQYCFKTEKSLRLLKKVGVISI